MGKSSESFDGMWEGNECRAAGTERQAAINSGRWCKYKYVILVWPTSWTASCTTLIVRVCVSGDMSPYCSAHDEWLSMKLCMYVRYHTANNVSNFGGDPVTQLSFKSYNA